MNFGAAASIGLEILQNRQAVGSAVNGLTRMTGNGFSQVAQKFGLSPQLGQQVQSVLQEIGNHSNQNGLHVLNGMQFFDADKNGQISRDELNQGLQKLQQMGLSQTGGVTGKLAQMGAQMLKSYDRLAQLDGNAASVSYQDMGKLMAQDGHQATLSGADWEKMNA